LHQPKMKSDFSCIIFICFFASLWFTNCKKNTEIALDEIESLIKKEKYETALLTIRKKLEAQRISDEVLSSYSPQNSRIVELSTDRNRLVWIEDNKLIFRDLANPTIKTRDFPTPPVSLSISYNASYAVVGFSTDGVTCHLKAISLVDNRPDYSMITPVKCSDRASISYNGSDIFFFSKNTLFKANFLQFNKNIELQKKSEIESPYPKISNKNLLFPIDKSFILFSGNAGAYTLYWFNPIDNIVEKLTDDILIPQIYYGNGSNGYLISGSVGNIGLREINFAGYDFPELGSSFSIEVDQMNPWETSKKEEFFSGKDGTVFSWGPLMKKRYYPILCRRFWGVARDHIVYENNNGEIVLSNMVFTPEEWKYLQLYQEISEKKKNF
jgi:hypothetical protein